MNNDDAEVILSIPLRDNREDCVAWHFDAKGLFSVKSAYKVSRHAANVSHGPSSGTTVHIPTMGTTFPWKKIWGLPIPNKVKHFCWRFAHNSLPLRRRVQSRGMDVDTRCPMCYRLGSQDVLRCIWGWDLEVQVKTITALWSLWTTRNDTNAGEEMKAAGYVAGLIQRHLADFNELKQDCNTGARIVKVWRPPAADYVKINIDGAFQEQHRAGGWGFVIRDVLGGVVGAGAGRITHCSDALQAEATAAIQALSFAVDAGMSRVELETDAINLKTALSSSVMDLSSNGMIFRDVKFLMFTEFVSVRVLHSSQSCNSVADKLAKVGVELGPGAMMLWPDSVPVHVTDLVATDLDLAFS